MKFKQLMAVAATAVFLSACFKSANEVRIKEKNFTNEIELQQNLVFDFSQDLVPDSLLDKWDTIPYVQITPEVKGKFKWKTTKELIFSPAQGFRPSTDYKAELTSSLLKHVDKKLHLTKEKGFNFHTPYLKLLTADAFWTKSTKHVDRAAIKINLNFNYHVDPTELFKLLHVSIDNKDVVCELVSNTVDQSVMIAVDNMSKTIKDDLVLKIFIDKGLRCTQSEWVSTQPMELISSISSPGKLQIIQVLPEFSGDEGFIHVYTSQSLDEQNIKSLIKLKPELEFKIENAEYGFLIKGDFKTGTTYELTIAKNLKGILGGELEKVFNEFVPFGQLVPSISFTTGKGLYLSSKSSKNVGISIVSVPKVKVTVYKVYENNINAFLNYNRWNDGGYYDEEGEEYYTSSDYGYNMYSMGNFGDQILEKVVETKGLPKANGASLLNLDLEDKSEFKGVYLVSVSSTEQQWVKATKLISISDIGLIVKHADNDILVVANSIKRAEPMSGIKINFVSTNNQTVYTTTTDRSGVAIFKDIKTNAPNFNIGMITARDGGDFNYVVMNDMRVETSRYDVGGRLENSSGYQAFMYGDRNIYRPGETIYLNTIVRNDKWEPVTDLPVKLKFLLPNGNEYFTIKKNLNKQGAFEAAIKLQPSSVTGTHIAEVYTANDILLSSVYISVEEFMPDRISVKLDLNKIEVALKDSVKTKLLAFNLFGPPAQNRNYQVELSLQRKYYSAKGYGEYNFSLKGADKTTFEKVLTQGKTDSKGGAKEAFIISEEFANMGLLAGKIFATVFDESGRPVNRVKTFEVSTQPAYFGIRRLDNYLGIKQPIMVSFAALDRVGKPLKTSSAKVQVIKYNWQNVIQKTGNDRYRYVSQKQEQILLDRIISFKDGISSLPFTPNASGEYEIRIMKPGTMTYVSESFYAYEYGATQSSSFQVNTEGQVSIEFDKEKYEVGDKANILFKTPFQGKLLVTVERNSVYEYFILQTDKKSAMLTLPIKEYYLPNVYIGATLIKPLEDAAIPLTVAHGFSPLMVEKKDTRIPITITAVEQSRSKMKQTVKVKAKPNCELTIAVVDEGILQLKDYTTPDPHASFFQKMGLSVSSHDVYQNLFPELKGTKSSTGGDGYDLSKRVNPLSNKRIQLVANWSGILKTNSDGEATYTFDIPQFSGDLRVMAVAYKDKSFGNADKHMKVADPIVISPALPRFLSPGDTLNFPVTVSNTTAKIAKTSIGLNISGAIESVGSAQQTVSIKPNSESQLNFRLVAKPMIGQGSVTVAVNALGETFLDKTELTIRPSTSLLKVSGAGTVNNSMQTIDLKNDFISSSVDAKLVLSKSPIVEFADNLTYLLGYPHGCLEQTVSKAFPQIYFSDIVKNINANKTVYLSDPNFNVQEAIRKIETMQSYNGGMLYWSGGSYENWWATVYATHFLQEAQKAGFEVKLDVLYKSYAYMQQMLKTKNKVLYYYNDENGKQQSKYIANKEVFYSLYVLAMANKPDYATMNYYKSNLDLLALDSKYLLAAAFLRTGDLQSYNAIIPKAFSGEKSNACFGGSFYSYIRDIAISLNALIEVDPNSPQVGIMTKHLTEHLKKQGRYYYSTQELSFSFLALGKLLKRANESNITAEITADGKSIGTYNNKDLTITKEIAGKSIKIKSSGAGSLYYFWQQEGISAGGDYKNEDSYLKVRKTFYNRYGQVINSNTFKQNDLVVVKISVVSSNNQEVDNVVITDMLPAGFEIENPRVGAVAELDWIKDNYQPDHFDIRDDRINFFATVNGWERHFYYLVRAVSKGNFRMGPVSADAMYNGEYHSYNGAGEIKIVE